jgi:hypothetical protein
LDFSTIFTSSVLESESLSESLLSTTFFFGATLEFSEVLTAFFPALLEALEALEVALGLF